jgi:methionyl-tRNA formyltransferase
MRIVFCGTPDYAVPSLKRLVRLAPKHQVAAVVSQPDKPKGRSKEPSPPPVVEAARTLGFSNDHILQPKSINKPEAIARLRELQPDILCVVAYGGLLRKDALELAKHFPINAHGSLLPKFRGASPIQAALLAGESETGVCIIKMEAGLDTGPVMLRRSIPISANDDAGSLHDKLAELSAQCFVEAIEIIDRGEAQFTPQDSAQASYAAKLEKNTGRIDWTLEAEYLERFVRAMNPWPGAWTSISTIDGSQQQRVRVWRAKVSTNNSDGPAGLGKANGAEKNSTIEVQCGKGALEIFDLQAEGTKPMSAADFLRGVGRKFVLTSAWK